MNLEFNCPHCNKLLAIDEKWRDTEVECPNCEFEFIIPAFSQKKLEEHGQKIDEEFVKEIRKNVKSKSTEELLKIWKENNREEWSNEGFEAVRQLLLEKGLELPRQRELLGNFKGGVTSLMELTLCPNLCRKGQEFMLFGARAGANGPCLMLENLLM